MSQWALAKWWQNELHGNKRSFEMASGSTKSAVMRYIIVAECNSVKSILCRFYVCITARKSISRGTSFFLGVARFKTAFENSYQNERPLETNLQGRLIFLAVSTNWLSTTRTCGLPSGAFPGLNFFAFFARIREFSETDAPTNHQPLL